MGDDWTATTPLLSSVLYRLYLMINETWSNIRLAAMTEVVRQGRISSRENGSNRQILINISQICMIQLGSVAQ